MFRLGAIGSPLRGLFRPSKQESKNSRRSWSSSLRHVCRICSVQQKAILAALVLALAPCHLSAQTPIALRARNGALQSFTLKQHPRVWLDGPNGPITQSVRDPDGIGPLKSPKASGPLWDALQARLENLKERESVDLGGKVALLAALGWFMDRNATYADGRSYRNVALNQLRNVHDVWVGLGGCDKASSACGSTDIYPGTHTSYMGNILGYWALAYSLMRSEMTTTERKDFAEKVLNGITVDIAGNCDNRYERLPGSLVISSNNRAAGTGTSWNQAMAGKWVYVKRAQTPYAAGIFVRVASVSSATSLVLDTPGSSNFFNKPIHMYRIKPWASGQCGMGYVADHYTNTPTYVVGYKRTILNGSISNSATTVNLDSASGFPSAVPFYIQVGSSSTYEVMKVTAISGTRLTVLRGEFSTTARSWTTKSPVLYQSHMGPGDAMGWNNRTLTRQVGHIMAAIALADDDPRAVSLLKTTMDYWYTNTWFAANNYFTMVNTAATSYGLSREIPFYLWSVQSMLSSFSPALDYRGEWVKWAGSDFFFHWSTPWDPNALINFGIAASNCQTLGQSYEIQCSGAAAFLQGLFPGSDEASRAWWWIGERGLINDMYRLTVDGGERILLPLILYTDGSLRKTDYRSQPTHFIGSSSSNPNADTSNFSVLSSRTNWSNTASLFYVIAPDNYTKEYPSMPLSEKLMDDLLGDYGIGKNGWLLGQVYDGYWMKYVGRQNVVDFGPVSYGAVNPYADLEIDRQKTGAGNKFLYARVDVKKGYSSLHQVSRAYRNFVHFKAPGSTEEIVVYDDFGSLVPQNIRGMLHYLNNGATGEGQTTLSADATQIVSDNTKAKLFTKIVEVGGDGIVTDLNVDWKGLAATVGTYCSSVRPCRAKIGGAVYSFIQPGTLRIAPASTGVSEVFVWLRPNGRIEAGGNRATVICGGTLNCASSVAQFPAGTLALGRLTFNNAKQTGECPGQIGVKTGSEYHHCVGGEQRHIFMVAGSGATSADFLVVHQPAPLTTTPDPVKAIGQVTAGFTGVQIGGANPKVAVFGGGGIDRASCQFVTDHAGVAQYLVAGLTSGAYEIRLGTTVLAANVPVSAADGALYFESASGNLQVRRTGTSAVLQFARTSSANATVRAYYSTQMTMTGGAGPYTVSILGSLPPGVTFDSSTAQLSGTPTASGVFQFLVAGVDSLGAKAVGNFQLVVLPPDNSVIVATEALRRGAINESYAATLSAIGGTAPYLWSVLDGALPEGLSFDDETGVLSGTPTESGTFRITFLVTDSAGAMAARELEIIIE